METDFQKAAQAVTEGCSIRGAAKLNGVSYSSLYKHVRSLCQKRLIMPPCGRLLYPDEEDFLAKYVDTCAEMGFPQTLDDICELAHWIVVNFPRPTIAKNFPGKHFAMNFIKRRSDLSIRTPSMILRAAGSVTESSMTNWFSWFEAYLAARGLLDVYRESPEKVFNCDETPLPTSVRQSKAVRKQKGVRLKNKLAQPNNKQMFTMLVTISASGRCLNPFMVLKGERVTDQLALNIPDGVEFVLSKEGYQTQLTFLSKYLFKKNYIFSSSNSTSISFSL